MEEADTALVVRVACVAARAEASHRSEMVTQWICGEPLEPLEQVDDWVRCRGSDGYEAWCSVGALLSVPSVAWVQEATLWSLGCLLRLEAPQAAAPTPAVSRFWLPFGARVAPASGGTVRLPDGRLGQAEGAPSLVDSRQRSERFPPVPSGVVETARGWLGTPYLWGGRTERGADCSGLIQAVFALHGVALPRDSGPQSETGHAVEAPRELDFERGDLLFFGAEGRITHVALAIGGTRILHAADANSAVAEDDLSMDSALSRRLRARLQVVRRPLPRASAGAAPGPGRESSPPRSRPRRPPRRHG